MKPLEPVVLEQVYAWLAGGDDDLRLASVGLTLTSGCPYPLIAYHAQQCAEKHLKALLVVHGIDFPFTHNLRRLIDLVPGEAAQRDELRIAEPLTPLGTTARYPGAHEPVSRAEAEEALVLAQQLRTRVRERLRIEFSGALAVDLDT
jgi:HEPN domain-containing protein